jgi:hypothetical protein
MAAIEDDLSRLSEQEIRERIKQGLKVRDEIGKADSHEVVRSGKAGEYLSRLESAGNTYKAAKAELARRAEAKSNSLRASAMVDRRRVLRSMRNTYSGWTCSAVYKVMKGTFSLALIRGIITRNPMDGLAPSERPKQRNARKIAVLDEAAMEKLVDAATTERWKTAIGLGPDHRTR